MLRQGSRIKGVLVAVVLAAAVSASQVWAWGTATHVYLAHELGSRSGPLNLEEMYGAALADLPNVMPNPDNAAYMFAQTHYEFMRLVRLASGSSQRAFAYGFASHNEVWGADFTAHILALTIPGDGYVTVKARQLSPLLAPEIAALLEEYGVSPDPALVEAIADWLAHTSVETAVDVLISRHEDPLVGYRMLMAAASRSWWVPTLFCRAYAAGFASQAGITLSQATLRLTAAEAVFKTYMEVYGAILTRRDCLDALAAQAAPLAADQIGALTGADVEVPGEFLKSCLTAAIALVRDDYAAEVRATLQHVDAQLRARGIPRY